MFKKAFLFASMTFAIGVAAQTCQQMSDNLGIDAFGNNGKTTPGRASREDQQRFANMGCQTRPKGAAPASFMGCQQMSDQLGTNHGVTWGRANPVQQQQWSANKCQTRPKAVAPAPPPPPKVTVEQMVAAGIKKVDLWEQNTTKKIDQDRLAMLNKIKKEEKNYDMMGRRMNSVNDIAKRDTDNVRVGADLMRKCFKVEKRENCFERY